MVAGHPDRGPVRIFSEMFLALKEMRRAKVRFGLLIAAIGLLVFLILFQQALQNGLITGFIGAIAHPVGAGARLQRRRPADAAGQHHHARARSSWSGRADGVGAAGRIGQGTFTGRPPTASTSTRRSSATRPEGLGSPDDADRGPPARRRPARPWPAPTTSTSGSTSATTVAVEPGGDELTVVGLADDAQLNVGADAVRHRTTTYVAAVAAPQPRRRRRRCRTRSAWRPPTGTTRTQLVDAINASQRRPRRAHPRPGRRRGARAWPRCASRSR